MHQTVFFSVFHPTHNVVRFNCVVDGIYHSSFVAAVKNSAFPSLDQDSAINTTQRLVSVPIFCAAFFLNINLHRQAQFSVLLQLRLALNQINLAK